MVEKPPKPNDPEIINAERICDEMRAIAKKLPHPEKKEGDENLPWEQFGNNFYLLFQGIKDQKTKPSSFTAKKLKLVEEFYSEKWKKFLQENSPLIFQIKEILKEQEIYDELRALLVEIYKNQKTWDIGDRISEEINLRGIGFQIWDKLNPLLEQASKTMKEYGINSEEFYS